MNAKDKYQYKRMRFFVIVENDFYVVRDAKHDNKEVSCYTKLGQAEALCRWRNNYG